MRTMLRKFWPAMKHDERMFALLSAACIAAIAASLIPVRGVGVGVTLSVAAIAASASMAAYFLRRLFDKSNKRLDVALDHMSQGLTMFDASARIILANARYRDMYKLSDADVASGTPLLDILQRRHSLGTLSLATDPERYIVEMVTNIRRHTSVKREVELPDGRWILMVNTPLADGGWVSTHEDITARRQAQTEREEARRFLNAVIEHVPGPVVVKDARDLRYVLINRAAERYFGLPRDTMIGKKTVDFYPDGAELIGQYDANALTSNEPLHYQARFFETPGSGRRFTASTRLAIIGGDGKPQYLVTLLQDLTEIRKTEDELRETRNFLDLVIEHVPASVFVKDAATLRYVLVNRTCEAFFGVPRERIIGRTAHEFFPKDAADVIAERDRKLLEKGYVELLVEEPVHDTGNGCRTISIKRLIINDDNGNPRYLMGVIEDITERSEAQARIAYLAKHDGLTGLPNRQAFNERLTQDIERTVADGGSLAVLIIDLDRFKELNDVFGHTIGDAILCHLGARLTAAAEDAFVARLGDDEFAVVARADSAAVERMAQSLLAAGAEAMEVYGRNVSCGFSIGVAISPGDGEDAATLVANAQAALERAKTAGRGTVRFFESTMDDRLRERRALVQDMRAATERGEMDVHYQPQATIDGQIVGFEALVRWRHPHRGLIAPGTFIPAAEESGAIHEIGAWILREACREAASWPNPLKIAINLSPVQFHSGDLPALVHATLLETGLAPERLELEITEGVLIGDSSRALSILRRLKLLGVRIAMDDFGTGYSSLSTLQAFPFDKIKIDRSFISNLGRNPQAATIVRAVIGLGRGLDLPVVAEGVENQEQVEFLAAESCHEIQGYLVGKPLPIRDYAQLVGRAGAPVRKASAA